MATEYREHLFSAKLLKLKFKKYYLSHASTGGFK
jgi:hypothetical protein